MNTKMTAPSPSGKIWTPANVITMFRIFLVPVFVVALLSPWPDWFGVINIISEPFKAVLAAIVFIIISCTDWIDGYLARSRGEVTDLGKFLDPLADKILVTAALIALVELQTIPSWPVLIILTREFIVSGIRMLAASRGYVIAASWYGKAKTVFQIIAIIMFLVKDYVIQYSDGPMYENPFYIAAWIVMLIALALTVISMLDYMAKARPLLWSSRTKKIRSKGGKGIFPPEDGKSAQDKVPVLPNDRKSIDEGASILLDLLRERSQTLCTAESLTGGMICGSLTAIAGSSDVVRGGFVTYATDSKHEILGVQKSLLDREGPVDSMVAIEMAEYSARRLDCDFSISCTGIAGPGGAEPGKPVGTVYIGMYNNGVTEAFDCYFEGDRESVRLQTVAFAIDKAIDILKAD